MRQFFCPLDDDRVSEGKAGRTFRCEAWLAGGVMLLSAGAIAAHFVLVFAGGWGSDEYSNFALFRGFGLQWLAMRTFQWSPRPASDGLLWLYSLAVDHWQAPLIAPFLTGMWAILGAATLGAAWQGDAPGRLWRLVAAAAVLAMFLLGHGIDEMFLWPMGASPYLLDLTGTVVVTLLVISGGTARRAGRVACAVALCVAATSSELGLFFAVLFTVGLLAVGFVGPRPNAPEPRGWHFVALGVTLATAACLARIVATNPGRGINQAGPYFHHFWLSLQGTLLGLLPDFLGGDVSSAGTSTWVWCLMVTGLFVGFLWACARGFPAMASWRQMAALGVGLAGCCVFDIFASFYEYGTRLHEPQPQFRRCLVVLALLTLARTAAWRWPRAGRRLRVLGPLALLGALGLGAAARAPLLISDIALIPEIRAARSATWDSGHDPAVTTLRFVDPPQGRLVLKAIPPRPGHIVRGAPGSNFWENGIMDFFGKPAMEFVQLPPRAGK